MPIGVEDCAVTTTIEKLTAIASKFMGRENGHCDVGMLPPDSGFSSFGGTKWDDTRPFVWNIGSIGACKSFAPLRRCFQNSTWENLLCVHDVNAAAAVDKSPHGDVVAVVGQVQLWQSKFAAVNLFGKCGNLFL